MRYATIGLLVLVACATGKGDGPADAMQGEPDAAFVASACPTNQFATGTFFDGTLQCAPIDAVAKSAMEAHCSLFFGWQDSCDGCTTAPAKWGQTSGVECANGVGANSTCAQATLGGVELPLFGLNLDGDANDDDKFHIGLLCTAPADAPIAGPCPAGSFLRSLGASPECVTGQAAISTYLADSCQIYFGWRDSCDGCTTAPTKSGHAGTGQCTISAGVSNTCSSFDLGGSAVSMLGINTDGDVNDDDKFYLGFQCSGATVSESVTTTACPPDELVVAVDSDGVHCASPLPEAEAAVQASCRLYFGWRDNCSGCATGPSKWGGVSHESCENGVGVGNTCAQTLIDGTSIQLLGVNTDGDVDDNDTFFLGMRCL